MVPTTRTCCCSFGSSDVGFFGCWLGSCVADHGTISMPTKRTFLQVFMVRDDHHRGSWRHSSTVLATPVLTQLGWAGWWVLNYARNCVTMECGSVSFLGPFLYHLEFRMFPLIR